MSRRSKILIGVIAAIFGIALAIAIPLSLSKNGEKRASASDATAEPTATVTLRPIPTPDHTPELPVWATRTTTDTTASPQALAFRRTLTEIGELYFQAFAGIITFEEMADKVYNSMSSEVQGQCTREFFVPEYARIQRDSVGTLPLSKEDLQDLRVDLDRFYTEEIAIGVSRDGKRAQVDTEISTFYPLRYPFTFESGSWKIRPERLC